MSGDRDATGPVRSACSPRAGRADRLVKELFFPDAGRRALADLFARGAVRVDGRRAGKGERVAAGATIEILHEPVARVGFSPVPAPDLDLEVLYVDPAIVVVNKPGRMPSHPLRADQHGTLASALVARFPECAHVGPDPREAGLVHRLDTGTSGALMAARSQEAHASLRRAFALGRVKKTYLALIERCDDRVRDGHCDLPLVQRGARVRVARPHDTASLEAMTSWRVLDRFTGAQRILLECTTHTGRTHQVRVHLAHALAPIVGDTRYGGHATRPGEPSFTGFFLHAQRLVFEHPSDGRSMNIRAPLPRDRDQLLMYLRDHLEIP